MRRGGVCGQDVRRVMMGAALALLGAGCPNPGEDGKGPEGSGYGVGGPDPAEMMGMPDRAHGHVPDRRPLENATYIPGQARFAKDKARGQDNAVPGEAAVGDNDPGQARGEVDQERARTGSTGPGRGSQERSAK